MSEILPLVIKYLGEPIGAHSKGNYKFRCPFHKGGQERRPSFYLHKDTGVSFCHTCNQGWALPVLLRELGVSRRLITAVSESIIPAPRRTMRQRLRKTLREVKPLPEDLLGVFEWCPTSLLNAGFEMGLLKDYEVGVDRNLGRITYPIRDHHGRLIAISGRGDFRYKIYGSKELAPIYDGVITDEIKKSWYVWNLHRLYPGYFHNEDKDPILIVEGFKACLWCIQHGYIKTVALMGSYISNEQARLLGRLGTEAFFLFLDQDSAGEEGTKRAGKVLSRYGAVRVVDYPRGGKIQPDDLNPNELEHSIQSADYHYRRNNGLRKVSP